MADGVPITAGSGTTIATDDTGATGHVQLVKLAYSADGSATLVAADSDGLKVNASGVAVPVTDNSGSITVDAPVGAPVFVRLSDGSSAIATLPVSLASVPSHAVTNAGTFAVQANGSTAADAAATTAPIIQGGRANNTLPSAVSADGDVVYLWLNRHGATINANLPHVGLVGEPYTLTNKTSQWTSSQTSAALWTPASGKKLVITSLQIQAGGTTAGSVQVWFGASADTSYTRGTDLAIFDGEFAPSSTNKPGVVMNGPWIASTADHVLKVASSAAINPLTVSAWGYEI